MKVIGVGLNKTGTSTLAACFRFWKLRHISFSPEHFDYWSAGSQGKLMQAVSNYESFENWPWALLYKEIFNSFEDAKFILTRRSSPEVWYESLLAHSFSTGPTRFRESIYGYPMPHDFKEQHLAFYLSHNQAVRDFFKDFPGTLLEVCWEEGDGWGELANFLCLPSPTIKFPHENQRPSM